MGNKQIGENSIIKGNVEIEEGVKIGYNCYIEGSEAHKVIIKKDSIIDNSVIILPGTRIGENSKISSYSILGYPTKADLIGQDVSQFSDRVKDKIIKDRILEIGNNSVIRSHTVIYSHVKIGGNFNTGHHTLIREHTTIGNNCVFGSHASCDGYTKIGNRSEVGQHCMLAQSATIGSYVFIGGHTAFSDNKYIIRKAEYDLFGAKIADYVRIGLNCIIFPDVELGENVLIGAGSVVTKNIPKNHLAYGNPIKIVRELNKEEIDLYRNSFH